MVVVGLEEALAKELVVAEEEVLAVALEGALAKEAAAVAAHLGEELAKVAVVHGVVVLAEE